MKWANLSNDAQSILEWQEHVLSGKPQVLVIERGKEFYQPCAAYGGDVRIMVTDELFNEIKKWLPHNPDIVHTIDGDKITTEFKEEIKAKLN
jgi:flavin-dependent dehydrogenase